MIDFHSVASKWMDAAKPPDTATYDPRKYRKIEATVRKLIIGGDIARGAAVPQHHGADPRLELRPPHSLPPGPSGPSHTVIHLS
jgi:hypothetical protein